MNNKKYIELAMRTNDGQSKNRLMNSLEDNTLTVDLGEVVMGCLGLSGEVGELNDMVKKFIFHGTMMDSEHFKKELGDIMWYIALICYACGYDLDDILQLNVDKLKARYPEGFSEYLANHRQEGDV